MPARVPSTGIHRVLLGRRRDTSPDMETVYQACDGAKLKLYPNEIREAVRILLGRHMRIVDIARLIGCCDRTVYRHKRALKEEGRL